MGQDASGLTTGRVILNSRKRNWRPPSRRDTSAFQTAELDGGGPHAAAPFEAYAYEDRFQAPWKLTGKEGPPRTRRRRLIDQWSSSFLSKERTSSAYPIRFSKQFLEDVFSEVSLQTRSPRTGPPSTRRGRSRARNRSWDRNTHRSPSPCTTK